VPRTGCRNLGVTLETRLQLCGNVVLRLDGRRVEGELPGRLGRLLFVHLAVNRGRVVTRDELLDALWPGEAPAAVESSLSALLSKTRRVAGPERLEGRSSLRLVLPADAWVDLDAATDGVHRAEAAFARRDWLGVYGPGRVTQHVCRRGFLPGEDAPWIAVVRRRVEELHVRSLELVGGACLEIGGSETSTAERCARQLVELAPYRESGHRLLMQVHAATGNQAESLLVYEALRVRLRDELGAAPSAETQALHATLLG
jgi:DNA-binding SARP family transcriptional activator